MPSPPGGQAVALQTFQAGRGEPLLLVHGWASRGAVFEGLVERLAHHRRCLTVDLRGHGESPAAPAGFTLRDHAADLVGLQPLVGQGRLAVLGWSMGAQIALEAAPLLGDRLSALVLVAGTAHFASGPGHPQGLPPGEVEALAARLRRSPAKALRRFCAGMFAPGELPEEERLRLAEALAAAAPDAESALSALAALVAADARPLLPSIRTPALLVHGEQDPIVPASASAFLAGSLQRARLETLPGAGHAPFLTRPDVVASLVADFLREHP